MTLEKQLADYGRLQEEMFGAIGVDDITDPLAGRDRHTSSNKTHIRQRITGRNRFAGPAWAVAAFITTIAVGGIYLVFTGGDSEVASQATIPTPSTSLTAPPNPTRLPEIGQGPIGPLDPGAYFADADGDPSTSAGGTFLIEVSGWMGSDEGVFRQNQGISLHVHKVEAPSAPTCDSNSVALPTESTAAEVAEAFASGVFTVQDSPAPVTAFGHDGYHLVVEVPEGCNNGMAEWGAQRSGFFLHPGEVMEVWIFDLDGQMVVVEALWFAGAPAEELAELRAVIDTLVLTP